MVTYGNSNKNTYDYLYLSNLINGKGTNYAKLLMTWARKWREHSQVNCFENVKHILIHRGFSNICLAILTKSCIKPHTIYLYHCMNKSLIYTYIRFHQVRMSYW